jgi:hypothetical protein
LLHESWWSLYTKKPATVESGWLVRLLGDLVYAPIAKKRAVVAETSVVLATSAIGAPSVVVSTQNNLILGDEVDPSHAGMFPLTAVTMR